MHSCVTVYVHDVYVRERERERDRERTYVRRERAPLHHHDVIIAKWVWPQL